MKEVKFIIRSSCIDNILHVYTACCSSSPIAIILVGEACVINLNILYIKALLVISHRSCLLSKCTYAYSSIYKLDQGLKLHLYHQNAHMLILDEKPRPAGVMFPHNFSFFQFHLCSYNCISTRKMFYIS